jgi:hypothetical protein
MLGAGGVAHIWPRTGTIGMSRSKRAEEPHQA